MNNKLSVNCSPGAYQLIEEDGNYTQQVASTVFPEQKTTFEEVIYAALDDQEPNEQENVPAKADVKEDKQCWHEGATKLLLSLMKDMRPQLGKSAEMKNKNKLYKAVSEEMAAKGYTFTATQVENKFRGLERQYKKVIFLNKQKTGRKKQTCPFKKELSEILGHNKRSSIPEFILGSEDVKAPPFCNDLDENTSEMENAQKDDWPISTSTAFKQRSQMCIKEQQLMQKLDEIKEVKKEFHNAVLTLLKNKEERDKNREKRSERKMELLEMLVQNTQSYRHLQKY